jgi:hypothetical protein
MLIKSYAGKAWTWLHDNALWLLLFVLGISAGRKLLKRKDSEVSTLKDALTVETHKNAIEHLKGRREEALKSVAESDSIDSVLIRRQRELEAGIAAHQRSVLALHDKQVDLTSMSDAEVEARFRDAGL